MSNHRYGICLCGRVQVALSATPLAVAACHCGHCRKTSGSAFSLVAVMPATGVAVTGQLSDYKDRADSGTAVSRLFCGSCGSPVETASAVTAKQGIRIIKLGLFDRLDDLPPAMEFFCAGRVGWLPVFEETLTLAGMPSPRNETPGSEANA